MTALRSSLTEPAARDLLDVVTWIAKDDPNAAQRTLRRLERAVKTLTEAPELGRRRETLGPGLRSLAVGRHVVIYRVLPGVLEVVRVIHGHRDIDAIFSGG